MSDMHYVFSMAFRPFLADRVKGSLRKEDLAGMIKKAVRTLQNRIGLPGTDSEKDLVKWASRLQKSPDKLFKFLADSKNLDKMREMLLDERAKIEDKVFAHIFANRDKIMPGLGKKQKERDATVLFGSFSKDLQNSTEAVLKAASVYFRYASDYMSIPEQKRTEIRATIRKQGVLPDFFNLSQAQIANILLRRIKAPSQDSLKRMKKGYGEGVYQGDARSLQQDKAWVEQTLSLVRNLGEPFRSLITSGRKTDMKGRILELLQNLPAGSVKGDLETRAAEIAVAFNVVRERMYRAENVLKGIYDLEQASTKAYEIRNAQSLASEMETLLREGRKGDLKRLIELRVNPKMRQEMIRKLADINPVLSNAMRVMVLKGKISNLSAFQKALEGEKNRREVTTFMQDSERMLTAVKNKAIMDRWIKKGFNPSAFFASSDGRVMLRRIREDVIEGLITDEKTLIRMIQKDKRVKKALKQYQDLDQKPKVAQFIGKVMYTYLGKQKEDLEKTLRTRYGDSIRTALGDEMFQKLVDGTIGMYYTSSVKSYVQATVFNERDKKFEMKPSEILFKNNETFRRYAEKLEIDTPADLTKKV